MSDEMSFLWVICGNQLMPGNVSFSQRFVDWMHGTEEEATKKALEYAERYKNRVYLARFKNELFVIDADENKNE